MNRSAFVHSLEISPGPTGSERPEGALARPRWGADAVVLSPVLAPLSLVSGAVVALVTLRKGPLPGLQVAAECPGSCPDRRF
jgi:hypothetical protein